MFIPKDMHQAYDIADMDAYFKMRIHNRYPETHGNIKILNVGGYEEGMTKETFLHKNEFWGCQYNVLDLRSSDISNIVKGNICDCPQIPDNSYEVILSNDTFEHIDEPWVAFQNIGRILKKGGMCVITTIFSWRYHQVPIDYWRYTPHCLDYLGTKYGKLKTLETNWLIHHRRANMVGCDENPDMWHDTVPIDNMGGFRENWRVYYIGEKL